MTFTGDEPAPENTELTTGVLVEARPAELGGPATGGTGAGGRLRRFGRGAHRVLRFLTAYPRVTIEAVLMVASLVVGLLILPSLAAATPGPPAIQDIFLERPVNVAAYLLFDDWGGGITVAVGMDVPPGTSAPWKLYVFYKAEDSLVNERMPNSVSLAGNLTSADIGTPGYKGAVFSGRLAGGSKSYTEFDNGYYQRLSDKFNFNSSSNGLPNDYQFVDFNLAGPVPINTVSGANLAVSLPTLGHLDDTTGKGQVAAPFNAEVFYDGGNYEAITGGATIEGGQWWDWFDHGFFPPTVATGLDAVKQQVEQNNTFIAAAMFGLSAAAAAALCVELVEAYQEHRRRRQEVAGATPTT